MPRKKKEDSTPKENKPTIFTVISYLTDNKKSWNELTEEEKKLFNPFMINRFLSMDINLALVVNDLQQYTLGKMNAKDVYNLYYYLLPKQKYFLKYITGKKSVPEADLQILKNYFKISLREIEDYYTILMKDDEGKQFLKDLKRQFQYEQ